MDIEKIRQLTAKKHEENRVDIINKRKLYLIQMPDILENYINDHIKKEANNGKRTAHIKLPEELIGIQSQNDLLEAELLSEERRLLKIYKNKGYKIEKSYKFFIGYEFHW